MIKRFLFLLITIIPIYCYAGTTNKDYVYDIEKDMYYTLDGNVYSGTIQYEVIYLQEKCHKEENFMQLNTYQMVLYVNMNMHILNKIQDMSKCIINIIN